MSKKNKGSFAKPYPEFPLTPHYGSGKFQKKIRGKVYYFGRIDDPESAVKEFLAKRDYLFAGIAPPENEGFTVADACNHFMHAKRQLLKSKSRLISQRAVNDYLKVCEGVVKHFGRGRVCSTIKPFEFGDFHKKLSAKWGPITVSHFVQRTRSIFKWCKESGHLEEPINFGPDFRPASKAVVRKERARRGKRLIPKEDLLAMVNAASGPTRAILLLGINGGLGQADIAQLEKRHINLKSQFLEYPRPKTGIDRIVPLWPETLDALREADATRPKVTRNKHLFFVSVFGNPLVYDTPKARCDQILKDYNKLKIAAKVQGAGKGFYSLRHTFQTIGDQKGDQVAVSFIMGHADESMAAVYREEFFVNRLTAITDHVHAWLFGTDP